jgi:predicted transcriptional regulator
MAPTRPPLLGELEAAVMDQLWSHGPVDVKTVHAAIGRKRRITLNTVQSTMERLHRKGLLDREKVSHAYVYNPRLSREAFGARVVEEVVSQVLGGETEPMLAAFVDVAARAGAEQLERLEQLIAKHRLVRAGERSK